MKHDAPESVNVTIFGKEYLIYCSHSNYNGSLVYYKVMIPFRLTLNISSITGTWGCSSDGIYSEEHDTPQGAIYNILAYKV